MQRRSSLLSSEGRANALVLALTVLVLLLGAEIVLRLTYHPEYLGTVIHYDSLLGWSLVPHSSLVSNDPHRGLHYRMDINGLGLRDDEVDARKPAGRKRVLVIGDSIAFGSGVEAGERFSEILERELPGVEVVNAGVPGWGNDQELLFYEHRLRGLDPDVVLLQVTANNDVVNNELKQPLIEDGTKPRFRCDDGALELEPPEPPVVVQHSFAARVRKVLRRSRLLLFAKRRLEMRSYRQHARENPALAEPGYEADRHLSHWSVYDTRGGPAIETAWEVTECIFARLADVCREDSARLVVFAFPLKVEVDHAWRDDLVERTGVDAASMDYMLPYRRLAAISAARGAGFVYPLDAFVAASRAAPLYFERDSHPNPRANEVAADALRDVLLPILSRR